MKQNFTTSDSRISVLFEYFVRLNFPTFNFSNCKSKQTHDFFQLTNRQTFEYLNIRIFCLSNIRYANSIPELSNFSIPRFPNPQAATFKSPKSTNFNFHGNKNTFVKKKHLPLFFYLIPSQSKIRIALAKMLKPFGIYFTLNRERGRRTIQTAN